MKKIKFKILYRCKWWKKSERNLWGVCFLLPTLTIFRERMPILAHDGNNERSGMHYAYGLTLAWLFLNLHLFGLEFTKEDKPDNDTDADNVQGPIVFHKEEC